MCSPSKWPLINQDISPWVLGLRCQKKSSNVPESPVILRFWNHYIEPSSPLWITWEKIWETHMILQTVGIFCNLQPRGDPTPSLFYIPFRFLPPNLPGIWGGESSSFFRSIFFFFRFLFKIRERERLYPSISMIFFLLLWWRASSNPDSSKLLPSIVRISLQPSLSRAYF